MQNYRLAIIGAIVLLDICLGPKIEYAYYAPSSTSENIEIEVKVRDNGQDLSNVVELELDFSKN